MKRKIEIISSEIKSISPSMAEKMLARNVSNRPLKRQSILSYAQQMKDGQWLTTHQGIAFNSEGQLIDGQNRLKAIALSGVTVKMTVTTYSGDVTALGMPFDIGAKRSAADIIGISGKSLETIAYCLRELAPYSAFSRTGMEVPIRDFCDDHRKEVDWVIEKIGKTAARIFSSAPIKAAVFVAHLANHDFVSQFYALVGLDFEKMKPNTTRLYKWLLSFDGATSGPLFRRVAFSATYMVATARPEEEIKMFKESSMNSARDDAKNVFNKFLGNMN